MDPMQFVESAPVAAPAEPRMPAAPVATAADPMAAFAEQPQQVLPAESGGFDEMAPAPAPAAEAAPMGEPVARGAPMGGGIDAGAFDGLAVGASDMGGGGGSMIPEANALREWEDKHDRAMEEKCRVEEQNRKERKEQAAKDIQAWANEQKVSYQKRQAHNRTEEKEFVAQIDAGLKGNLANPWERVVNLIDTSSKAGTDKGETNLDRMKSLMIQLKANPPAAAGTA